MNDLASSLIDFKQLMRAIYGYTGLKVEERVHLELEYQIYGDICFLMEDLVRERIAHRARHRTIEKANR